MEKKKNVLERWLEFREEELERQIKLLESDYNLARTVSYDPPEGFQPLLLE